MPEFLAKQLLKQFGLPFHLAPGEAEAECALLQREGIVDAVLSEDVDTLMFGSGLTLRNWSPEGGPSRKVPTHVNVYDAKKTKAGKSGLDSEGMVLVALMSGGDYIPAGVPGCGPKTACEAARAGFGADLCSISRRDTQGLRVWRERLQYELRTNESKYFRNRHPKLVIPDDFPDRTVLKYYVRPAVSTADQLSKLRQTLQWDQEIDFPALRTFTGEAFDWRCIGGAKKFIRNLAPALLVRELRLRATRNGPGTEDLATIRLEESRLVQSIHGRRTHPLTDNVPELRVGYMPIDLVAIDLEAEPPDEPAQSEAQGDDSDSEEDGPFPSTSHGDRQETEENPAKKRGPSNYDPTKNEKIWVMETFLKVGVPLKVQDWEQSFRNATEYAAMKAANQAKKGSKSQKTAGTGMQKGALDRYTRVTKPASKRLVGKPRADLPEPPPTDGTQQADARRSISPPPAPSTPTRTFRPPVLPSPSPSRNRQQTLIDLLSPSPLRTQPATQTDTRTCEAPALPSTVTKRRRRSPFKRTQTLPVTQSECITTFFRPVTPSLEHQDQSQSLDLDSPSLISPSRGGPMKRAKSTAAITIPPRQSTSGLISLLSSPIEAPRALPPTQAGPNNLPMLGSIESVDLSFSPPRAEAPTRYNPRSPARSRLQSSIQVRSEEHDMANTRVTASTSATNRKVVKKIIQRMSLAGSWKIDETIEVADLTASRVLQTTDGNSQGSANGAPAKKRREPKGWRLSEVETIDMTSM